MIDLWHYTCEHSRAALLEDPFVRPIGTLPQAVDAQLIPDLARFCWFTDLDEPIADALGLTMRTIQCDRTVARFAVLDPVGVFRWTKVRRTVNPLVRAALEAAQGAMPAHWWVADAPVPVKESPRG